MMQAIGNQHQAPLLALENALASSDPKPSADDMFTKGKSAVELHRLDRIAQLKLQKLTYAGCMGDPAFHRRLQNDWNALCADDKLYYEDLAWKSKLQAKQNRDRLRC